MLRRFQPKAVPESNAPFSQVVTDDHYAFLSGLVATDLSERRAALGDVGAETRAVFTAIRGILAEIEMNAFPCSYLPLYPLKVGHQIGKL